LRRSVCVSVKRLKGSESFLWKWNERKTCPSVWCMFTYWITQKAFHSSTRDSDLTLAISGMDMMMEKHRILLLMQDCSQFVHDVFIWFIRATAPTRILENLKTREGNLSNFEKNVLYTATVKFSPSYAINYRNLKGRKCHFSCI
jgi:hypothetical protein